MSQPSCTAGPIFLLCSRMDCILTSVHVCSCNEAVIEGLAQSQRISSRSDVCKCTNESGMIELYSIIECVVYLASGSVIVCQRSSMHEGQRGQGGGDDFY